MASFISKSIPTFVRMAVTKGGPGAQWPPLVYLLLRAVQLIRGSLRAKLDRQH